MTNSTIKTITHIIAETDARSYTPGVGDRVIETYKYNGYLYMVEYKPKRVKKWKEENQKTEESDRIGEDANTRNTFPRGYPGIIGGFIGGIIGVG